MRNKILLIALAVSLSSCSVFRKKDKEKNLIEIDSSVTKAIKEKSIDTGSISSYKKTTIYSEPITSAAQQGWNWNFNYPWSLINAANGLAQSAEKVKDETNSPFAKPTRTGLNGTANKHVAATIEEWAFEKKGITQEKAADEKIDLNKNISDVKTNTEGNPKTFSILIIGLVFIVVIALIFLFLYLKSKRTKL